MLALKTIVFHVEEAGVKCLCGGCKKSPRTLSLLHLSILAGLLESPYAIRCIWKLNTTQAGARDLWVASVSFFISVNQRSQIKAGLLEFSLFFYILFASGIPYHHHLLHVLHDQTVLYLQCPPKVFEQFVNLT